ncbi:MAG TPA: glycosyltransferase family 4 protein [Pyrinomonadaceae bacterium]|nr:glycosyltransferase family 4 protein [Pyrinomonadaceae bacterium]
MRILQLSSASTLGGGERHFADLSNALAARGHEVYAALRPDAPLRERLGLTDARVITLPLRNALDVASASRLAAFAREHGIEIVHAHVARDYPLAAHAVRLARGTRLVLTRHVPFALNSLHRIALANVSRVIAVSAGVARKLREQGIFSPDKIRVVPNGVDFDHYDRALEGFDREKYRRTLSSSARLLAGTVGELSETKGQEDFLRAAAAVVRRAGASQHGAGGVEFLVVGEDNSEDQRTRRRLERIVEEENLRGRVHFRGYAPDLPRLLAALDVYVSASRAEAFGLATVEAMICGAPVVATATDGSREIVEDGRTGRIVPAGDVEAMAAALSELLGDERERERFSTNALHSVTERFSLKRMVDETERIYRSVLS